MQRATPSLIVDEVKLQANIGRMQRQCDAHKVQLWPHVKTHKCVEIARRQLAAGATGLVCAKLGEAEAMLASGVRQLFIAYPLVDPQTQALRLRALAESLDELIVAVTSLAQAEALGRVLTVAAIKLSVLMAVDTGLNREGARDIESALEIAGFIEKHPHMRLIGLFTHEGQTYREGVDIDSAARDTVERLSAVREAVDPALTLWPGCSVTAAASAALPGVHAVRPGAYVFGDLWLAGLAGRMNFEQLALSILSSVVDRPQPGLALIDAGSKTFSSDKTPDGISAAPADRRNFQVTRLSEEHGWVTGPGVDDLEIGERLHWIPAHVCPAVNLADELLVMNSGQITDCWRVDARGKVS